MKTYHLTNPLTGTNDPAAQAEILPLQNALKKNKFYGGKLDGIFGAATGDACKTAKFHLGYPSKACVRTGGQKLFDYLTGAERLPLAFSLRRKARGYGLTKEDKMRTGIISWAHAGVAETAEIHYAQIRPIPSTWRLPMTTDCSGFVTLCYKMAGAKDPNRDNYNGDGWTGTLLNGGETIPLSQARPADLVIWGVYPGHHVAVIVDTKNATDPQIVSHGDEAGPLLESLSAETAAQARSYVVKRYTL